MIDTDDIGSNESGNPHLADMIEAQLSRRSVLTRTMSDSRWGLSFHGNDATSTSTNSLLFEGVISCTR
jgi:hypothetical protein